MQRNLSWLTCNKDTTRETFFIAFEAWARQNDFYVKKSDSHVWVYKSEDDHMEDKRPSQVRKPFIHRMTMQCGRPKYPRVIIDRGQQTKVVDWEKVFHKLGPSTLLVSTMQSGDKEAQVERLPLDQFEPVLNGALKWFVEAE